MAEPTTEELNLIACEINYAYNYVVRSLTAEELGQFEAYVHKLEAIRPLIDPTSYIHNEHAMILEASKRLRALQAFFKALE